MREHAEEKRKQARSGKKEELRAANLADVLAKIKAMAPEDKKLASKVHEIVTEVAPHLEAKTWYGMPAWANEAGKAVVFFQDAGKFKARYSTLGFQDAAKLDSGQMWATSFALTGIDAAVEKQIRALIKKAAKK